MARSVEEWIGKTDDSVPSTKCKQRILERQGRRCAITDREFTAKDKPQFDHITPLWLGGQNRESNLQAILAEPHKHKTKSEATVRAKVEANTAKHFGLSQPRRKHFQSRPFPPSEKAAKRAGGLPLPPPRPIYATDLLSRGQLARAGSSEEE